MSTRSIVLAGLVLSRVALAEDVLFPMPRPGVTGAQVAAAAKPISVATYNSGGTTFDLRCKGDSVCEVWELGGATPIAAADKIHLCRASNAVNVHLSAPGWEARALALPGFINPPHGLTDCGG